MKKVFPKRKDRIILTSIDIINDYGIQGLSTRELAKRQDITESLLYRYFKSKDEIIIAVIEYYSSFDIAIMNTILKSNLTFKLKIIEFIRLYLEYYENYPAITAISSSYYQLMSDINTRDVIKNIYDKRNSFLLELIKAAQEKDEINQYYTSNELIDIIIGLLSRLIIKWRLDGYTFSLKDRTLEMLEKIIANS
jgi:AcrR family transcriptional regulator